MVKAWEEFVQHALHRGEMKDAIVDEHSLLCFINFCAERCKRDHRGNDISGTFLGAVHLSSLQLSVYMADNSLL
ncbi:hypothetical protein L208DRAFT_1251679 [Tricholoma matsutake]|nr:hypothetical protein L208DRAFT_1251679 [Tricholoma matsutake 945]